MAMAQSMSRSIDDDEDCESFVRIGYYDLDNPEPDDNPRRNETIVQEDEEEFSDAVVDLATSSETISPPSITRPTSNEIEAETNKGLEMNFPGRVSMMEEELFSMTSCSTVSDGSANSERQYEEMVMANLKKIVQEHKEIIVQQNLQLENSRTSIEELKLMCNESLKREKEKEELFRRENLSLSEQLRLKTEQVAAAQQGSSTKLGDIEMKKQLDDVLDDYCNQIKELATQLHVEVERRKEAEDLLRQQMEQGRMQIQSLSSSDEALAKSLNEKERLEGIIQEAFKTKNNLEEELSNLKQNFQQQQQQFGNELNHLRELTETLESKRTALEMENQGIRVQLATLRAEQENINERISEEKEMLKNEAVRYCDENAVLKQDVSRLNEMLQARTTEVETLRAQAANPGNSGNGSMTESVMGFFRKPFTMPPGAKGFGIRDANDDPNEPFEHVGAHTPPATLTEFRCPICNRLYSTLRKLQYHASECRVNPTNSNPFVFP